MNKLLVLAISLFLAAACGPDTEAAGAGPSFGEQTTVADLPADFPHALIPPAYDRMEFIDMSTYGGLTTANFENSQNAAEAIRYYTELIGAASTTVPPQEDGEMTSIWNETPHPPWILSVIGNSTETIVSVGKPPKRAAN